MDAPPLMENLEDQSTDDSSSLFVFEKVRSHEGPLFAASLRQGRQE